MKYKIQSRICVTCPDCKGAGTFDLWDGPTQCERCDGCGMVAREQFWTRVRPSVQRVAA